MIITKSCNCHLFKMLDQSAVTHLREELLGHKGRELFWPYFFEELHCHDHDNLAAQ